MNDFIELLPKECQAIQITPRHKVALEHFFTAGNDDVWVVLLTKMPGDCPKAWHMTRREYWSIQPKHGTRDRWIRENMQPSITGRLNPPKQKQLTVF